MAQVVYGQTFSGGVVHIPPSKSAAHRQVLCAALSQGKCTLSHVDMSEDIKATVAAVTALGAQAQYDEQTATLTLDATGLGSQNAVIDCGESGSTLRFLIPIAAALGASARFLGHGRLPQRPLGIYANLLPSHGVEFRTQGGLPLEISGRLKSGVYRLPGDVSSQFVTGLLFALPLLDPFYFKRVRSGGSGNVPGIPHPRRPAVYPEKQPGGGRLVPGSVFPVHGGAVPHRGAGGNPGVKAPVAAGG